MLFSVYKYIYCCECSSRQVNNALMRGACIGLRLVASHQREAIVVCAFADTHFVQEYKVVTPRSKSSQHLDTN